MITLPDSFRVLRPHPNVLAFYDGRVAGRRLYSPEPNWIDDGAYELGIASYAIVSGDQALVYDTHISLAHARAVREALAAEGATKLTIVLSHWHDDHIAGNEVFADCDILSNRLTAEILAEKREHIESMSPPIKPLVLPTKTFDGETTLSVGDLEVELKQFEIHSSDETLMLFDGLLFAGDALEDTCTYVSEPERLAAHLVDLARLKTSKFDRILPNHGAPEIIEAGGYNAGLIDATESYVRALMSLTSDDPRATLSLKAFIADDLAAGRAVYFGPYETVHRNNVKQVLALAS
ncbi:MBL fold metallo-hydrolase [Hansschlegelia quercus]|uniref:MBL fold metallo-hydrolase n=1 Tax=Hansschlegelia quercus TaxID=2528245 RepID=A0A4Q9GNR8_9HYPH|nr:MBL fold metallo-hydrolase [Hansschlegelia quercus]TBN55161.1 MBL fold metallo-hydrolase [Hansschlegelia quercus]